MISGTKSIKEGFWQLADPKIWIASAIPMAISAVFSINSVRQGSLFWFVLAVIAIFLIEIGKNAVNEVVDYISGVDRYIEEDKKTPFSGGKKSITEGKLTISQAKRIAVLTYIPAVLIGLVIAIFREPLVIYFGMAGVGISVLYSLPPFKLAYRGLGEVAVGFTFGPLLMTGMNLLLTGMVDMGVVAASVPVGLLIANVLWINQFPDYEADKKGGKRNWVVRFGKSTSAQIHGLFFLITYLSFAAIAIIYGSAFMLLPFLSLPLAIRSWKNAVKNHEDIGALTRSNIATIRIYQLTGALMIAGYILYRIF